MASKSSFHQAVANLLLVAGSVLLTVLIVEVALRAVWDGFYLKGEPYSQRDAVRGWVNRPNVVVSYGEPEFVTTVSHNSHGFRGGEVPLEPEPGRKRILVLGDSFAYGVGVEDDETFSALLARRDPDLDVINTGVNGYGTNQQLLLLRDDGRQFEPDIVLVAFFWNDPANNLHSHVRFKLEGDELVYPDAIEFPAAEVVKPRRPWLRRSYAYRFASDRLKVLIFRLKGLLGRPQADGWLRPHEYAEAWELEFALLREVKRVAAEAGAAMYLVIIPDQVQVHPGFETVGLTEDDYQVQDRLLDFAASAEIPALDLLPALREDFAEHGGLLYYRRDRHLTARGHRVAARAIHDGLVASGLLTR